MKEHLLRSEETQAAQDVSLTNHNALLIAMLEGTTPGEAHLDALFEVIPSPFFVKDLDGRYLGCNSAFEEYIGLTRSQILGKTVYDVAPRELADRYAAADQTLFDNPGTQIYEARVCWADGSLRDVVFHKSTISGPDGKVRGLTGIILDITERKKMELSLRQQEQQYRTLVEHSPDLIVRYDRDLHRTYVNPAWEKASGLSADEVINVPAHKIPKVPQPLAENYVVALKEALLKGVSRAVDFSWVNAYGKTLHLQFVVVPETDHTGRVTSLLSVGRDVTEYKRAVEAMRKGEEHLQRVNRALRTLSAGNEALIRASSEQELLEQMCQVIVDEGGYLLTAITDVSQQGNVVGTRAWAGVADKNLQNCIVAITKSALAASSEPGAPRVVHDISCDPLFKGCAGKFLARGAQSAIILPLTHKGKMLGVLSIYSIDPDSFDDDEVVLLNELVNDLSYGIRAMHNRIAKVESLRRVQETMEKTIQALASTIELRDPYTAGHQRRVAQLAVAIGRELELSDERLTALYLASIVHDIGKIKVPAEVLSRPGKLSEFEYRLVQTHVDASYEILKPIDFPWPIAEIVHQHHECMDGSGYPKGLTGDKLLLESRILAVCDAVEAISSHRPFRPAYDSEHAMEEIISKRGRLFDEKVVDICVRLFREKGFEFD